MLLIPVFTTTVADGLRPRFYSLNCESGSGENATSGLCSIASVRFRRTERSSDRSSRAGGESSVHGWAFQPFGGEVRRTVEEARDRGCSGHPFSPVLQACAALQRPLFGRDPVEGRHRVPTSGRGTGWKAPRGDIL